MVTVPGASAEEVAAILAAIDALWPRPAVAAVSDARPSSWRWSGRWWASGRPVAAERRRPN